MKLKIMHTTHYKYEGMAVESVNELRLTPNTNEHQTCQTHTIVVEPAVPLFTHQDFFGNTVHFFTVYPPHSELKITMDTIVETHLQKYEHTSQLTFTEEMAIIHRNKFQNDYAEYLMETTYTVLTKELQQFTKEKINTTQFESVYKLLEHISQVLYTNFTYDPTATNVNTTIEETLRLKRGVCQDYAHLMIAICRIFRIPARYVSGYHFIGDPDNNELEVQHASHAWVEAYVPNCGWVPFDPTNNGIIDWRYVKTSHGRDYSDVAPVKGVYKGASTKELIVSVNVEYIKE